MEGRPGVSHREDVLVSAVGSTVVVDSMVAADFMEAEAATGNRVPQTITNST
jgi:hypothetical protein